MNRVDEIIIFDPLTTEQIGQIVELMVKEVEDRLIEHEVTISLPDAAKEWLTKEGFDPVFGARPLRRAVQRFIENPLSRQMISGEFASGDHVKVDVHDEALTFTKAESPVGASVES